MTLTFLGTRGEIEARSRRHRMHSSLLVACRNREVMIDCGLDWSSRIMNLQPDHEAAALVSIGAFIIHIYMGVFLVPDGFRGMLFGYVPAAWAKMHHRLWYDEVVGQRSGNR